MRACFNGDTPEELVSGENGAHKYLIKVAGATVTGGRWSRDGRIIPDVDSRSSCLRYSVDLRKASRESGSGSRRFGARVYDETVIKTGAWLWVPRDSTVPLEIEFARPSGLTISTPWHRITKSTDISVYRIDPESYDGSGYVIFGGFADVDVRVHGGHLRVAILEGKPPAETVKLSAWIERVARTMTLLYGRYPLDQAQLLIFPVGKYSSQSDASPVPWGEVKRGGGSAVHLYVDHTRPLSELVADWTLYHEMSHMMHPYIGMEGRWLSEGMASYYQNVLMARGGVLSERRAWQKLHNGFGRGIGETRKGRRLREVSDNMYRNRQYMRVYWSGAAIAMLADVRLRMSDQGSLDEALSRFRDCCLPSSRTWTSLEFMQKLDELMETDIFVKLHNRYIDSDEFPDVHSVYNALGLVVDGNRIRLNDAAAASDVRDNIMQPRDGS